MISIALAYLMTVLLIPTAIRLAMRFRMLDLPDRELKNHDRPIPRIGGVTIGLVVLAVLVIMQGSALGEPRNIGLVVGGIIVTAGGMLDDRYRWSPLPKVVFQAAAGMCIWSFGIGFRLFEWAPIDFALSMLWLIGVINAVNLIDIMDGLAPGVAGIASMFMFMLLRDTGDSFYGAALLGIAGACAGFLVYNFKPASVYLGDAGSQLLGYILACSALRWGMSEEPGAGLLLPVTVLAIPLFETAFVSIMRMGRGRSPFKGSGDHYALRMVKLGYSVRTTVLLSYAAAVSVGLVAALMLRAGAAGYYAAAAVAAAMLYAGWKLGRVHMGKEREEKATWRKSC